MKSNLNDDSNSPSSSANMYLPKGGQETPNVSGYVGTVVNIHPLSYQIVVSVDGGKTSMVALWVSALLSSLTGLSVKSYPQIGQQVFIIKDNSLNTGEAWC